MESGEGHDWFALSSPATLMLHPCPNCGAELGVAGDAASCPECDIEYVWVIGSGWMTPVQLRRRRITMTRARSSTRA
jgi:hypothetical protein